MTRVLLPGRWNRDGRAVPLARHCYLSDEEARSREERVMAFEQVEEQHNFPAVIWWLVVAIASIACFFAGLLLGDHP